MSDPLKPEVSLLCKLGSVARHVDEAMTDGHPFDLVALRGLLDAPDVRDWMDEMDKMALLPIPR